MKRFQSKGHNIGTYTINKVFYLATMTKNRYFHTKTLGYHLFMELLVNHTKIK